MPQLKSRWIDLVCFSTILILTLIVFGLDSSRLGFYADDASGIPQYQHLWFDGKRWHHQYISRRTQTFVMCGAGTLKLPISRPELLIDKNDNLFVICQGDLSQNRLMVTPLLAPNYRYDSNSTKILDEQSIGFAEPIVDHERWEKENILTMFIQYNDQSNHDDGNITLMKPIYLVDFKIYVE
jgi:hypothetical protein